MTPTNSDNSESSRVRPPPEKKAPVAVPLPAFISAARPAPPEMMFSLPALPAIEPPLITGGSVIRVPPWPSEVALKFAEVYEPTKVRVAELVPSLTVSVPPALIPEASN
jgi:hypothetical protein